MKKGKKPVRYSDLAQIKQRIVEEKPTPGVHTLITQDYLYDYRVEALKQEMANDDPDTISKKLWLNFKDLPISDLTKKGKCFKYIVNTESILTDRLEAEKVRETHRDPALRDSARIGRPRYHGCVEDWQWQNAVLLVTACREPV